MRASPMILATLVGFGLMASVCDGWVDEYLFGENRKIH